MAPGGMNAVCAGVVRELSHKWQKHCRFYRKATPASFWERNLAATMEKLEVPPQTSWDFFAFKMSEFGAIPELAAKLVDKISHNFLTQRRVLKKRAASRESFWKRNGNEIMTDYGKDLICSKLLEVTLDTTKLGEAGEAVGIDLGEGAEPLKDVMTISITPDEYDGLADLMEMEIVKEIGILAR